MKTSWKMCWRWKKKKKKGGTAFRESRPHGNWDPAPVTQCVCIINRPTNFIYVLYMRRWVHTFAIHAVLKAEGKHRWPTSYYLPGYNISAITGTPSWWNNCFPLKCWDQHNHAYLHWCRSLWIFVRWCKLDQQNKCTVCAKACTCFCPCLHYTPHLTFLVAKRSNEGFRVSYTVRAHHVFVSSVRCWCVFSRLHKHCVLLGLSRIPTGSGR